MEDTHVIRYGGVKFFFFFCLLFVCLVFKKLLMKEKLNLYSGFLIRQYDLTQFVLLMIFIKFENLDKTSFKTEQAWFLLLQWV